MNDENPYRSPLALPDCPRIELAEIFDLMQAGFRRTIFIPVGVRFVSLVLGYDNDNACMIAAYLIGILGLSCLLLSWVLRR